MMTSSPVSMYVWGTECEAVVNQGRVDHRSSFSTVQQVVQVTQVSFTAAHAVTSTVLVKHKHLARTEPTLHTGHNTYTPVSYSSQHKHLARNEPTLHTGNNTYTPISYSSQHKIPGQDWTNPAHRSQHVHTCIILVTTQTPGQDWTNPTHR